MGHQKDPKETQSAALQQKGHLPNSYRNTAQNRGTVPRKKVGSPIKSTRRKERDIPRRKEAQKQRPQTSPGGSTAAARWGRPPGD